MWLTTKSIYDLPGLCIVEGHFVYVPAVTYHCPDITDIIVYIFLRMLGILTHMLLGYRRPYVPIGFTHS